MFKRYIDVYESLPADIRRKIKRSEFYQQIIARTSDFTANSIERAHMMFEYMWGEGDKPYYNIYPSILEMLLRIDISTVKVKDLRPPSGEVALIVNLPAGNKLISPWQDAYFMFISIDLIESPKGKVKAFAWNYGEQHNGMPIWDVVFGSDYLTGSHEEQGAMTMAELYKKAAMRQIASPTLAGCGLADIDTSATERLVKLGTAICLLASDCDLLIPQVLSKDLAKVNDSNRNKLFAKAVARGKKGWTLGEHIERIPGERRPHPALYWTGKGGKIPKVLIRSGCIVRKDIIAQIPTGYQGVSDEKLL